MTRLLGIIILVAALYGVLFLSHEGARSSKTLGSLTRDQAFRAVLTMGAAVVIIAGGIDLSLGSVVALGAVLFAGLMSLGCPPLAAVVAVLGVGLLIGLIHGLMITKLQLQPFLVTLCSLFIYRGLARFLSFSQDVGVNTATEAHIENESFREQLAWVLWLAKDGSVGNVPALLLFVLGIAALLAVLLHATVYGRYTYAIGSNEQAVRYAGIPTDRYKILTYAIGSFLAAMGGVLELLREGTASAANCGMSYELYAIAGAVMGGCSLRGGQGNVLGILLGATVLPLLSRIALFLQVKDSLKDIVIGLAMLVGTLGDELLKRRSARR